MCFVRRSGRRGLCGEPLGDNLAPHYDKASIECRGGEASAPGRLTRGNRPPPPSLPYKVDTSRPSLRTNWTRLVHPSAL
jgi:hypothetical protein